MSPGDSTVLFRALPIRLKFSKEDQRLLLGFASVLSQTVADACPFTCLVTNDATLQELNHQFLGRDYPTDVLSFPTSELEQSGGQERTTLGDLAISVERAEVQALEFGHRCVDEVRVLMLHGLLHLLGFDHETDDGEMAHAEQKWRRHFGLSSSLIARQAEREFESITEPSS